MSAPPTIARPGPRNALSDIAGLRVGNAEDAAARTGVTVVIADAPFACGVDVRGAAPGTRETDLLAPTATVPRVHALVLAGGSAWGLAAADGAMAALRDAGMGFTVGDVRVPIVPAAILFDLGVGTKPWARAGGGEAPHRALGLAAAKAAMARADEAIGSVGAGLGCTTADAAGGLGTASVVIEGVGTVAALVAVNAVGSALVEGGPSFLGEAWLLDGEAWSGGTPPRPTGLATKLHAASGASTTIGIVATDMPLDKAGCARLAAHGQDGYARALVPVHTALDGDLVFGVSTGGGEPCDDPAALAVLGEAATRVMARAIMRGVHAASAQPDGPPAWTERFPELASSA